MRIVGGAVAQAAGNPVIGKMGNIEDAAGKDRDSAVSVGSKEQIVE